ncbi:hypothetical protein JQ634_30740 [Bradyrhizobium sp. AUGA SZCCT0240]|uniref:hypothetical protein n=1 Tax=unclassified Bradyrhizobium TaxID=2631580 RepID=UPI001BAD2ADE|nr:MULTISPECIES: hypothetical protein [unclassified Bradyrhizobium]MBR1193822.1 hypothetical protein [Bradyrhizobium sp. AUGA SZCCT0160]MBR1199994.1 hypothetical protein [Bradyrhizobium sp. AUGA SZCCT0158]MBR1244332.1 hypothetical protein [Bradyrhizobium sp. AUGA SZCCT0274]MBR1258043.1 hypothetical protein [Bradyrhizobium sp. AUGA SZCCT0240]
MGKRWTDEDIQDLRKLAQRHPIPKIAEIMNRTVGGIVFKAHKLKVSLKSRNQDKRENFVRRSRTRRTLGKLST